MHGKELSQDHLEVLFNGIFTLDDFPVARHKVLYVELSEPRDALCQDMTIATR
jgi:hypothetical protein